MQKTSIRFFEDVPVRAVWDEESSKADAVLIFRALEDVLVWMLKL